MSRNYFWVPLCALLIGITAWCVTFCSAWNARETDKKRHQVSDGLDSKLAARGQFGDSFGATSALFSMIAMVGAAWAVYKQHQDSVEALRDQHKSSHAQAVATMASSINAWADLTKRLTYDGRDRKLTWQLIQRAKIESRYRVMLEIFVSEFMIGKEKFTGDVTKTPEYLANEEAIERVNIMLQIRDDINTTLFPQQETQPDNRLQQFLKSYPSWISRFPNGAPKSFIDTAARISKNIEEGRYDHVPDAESGFVALSSAVLSACAIELSVFKDTAQD
jgi:hypothetical protein